MNIEELKVSLKEDNKRLKKINGYHDDGLLFVGGNLTINPEDLKKHREIFKEDLPDSYIDFHKNVVSVATFGWHINAIDSEENIYAFAESNIVSFDSILQKRQEFIDENYKWYKDFGKTHLLKNMRDGYYCLNYKKSGPYVLIKFEKNSYELFLLLEDGSLNKMSISLTRYFELLYQSRGLFLWQAYITDVFPKCLRDKEYDGFFENMEYLFPTVDLNQFKHRDLVNPEKSIAHICKKYNYKEKLHSAFENLSKKITLHKVNEKYTIAYSPSGIQIIRNIEEHLQLQLPESLKVLYWQMDGFNLKWTYNHEDYSKNNQMANFKIASLFDMFGGIVYNQVKEKYCNNAAKTYNLDQEKHPYLIGKYVFYTDPYCHLLLEFIDHGKLKIWLHYLESDTRKIELTLISENFDEVLNHLIKYRGMFYWPLFVNKNHHRNELQQKFFSNVNELFPNILT